jgi:hypothetical protein
MPINPGRLPGRRQVAWFEIEPPEDGKRAFEDRGFLVTSCVDSELIKPDYLAGLTVVVFTQHAEKALQIVKNLKDHARRLLNFDCQVILRPGSEELSREPQILTNVIDELRLWTAWLPRKEAAKLKWWKPIDAVPPLPYALFCGTGVGWNHIANVVADNPPGPAPAPETVLHLTVHRMDEGGKMQNVVLPQDSELLIRRAFWNCADVHLVAMDDGRSGAQVYRAYAELASGLYGRWPLPHFVKIGDRRKIFAEYQNYEGYVRPYVPFHLGPHLMLDRCCLGADKGVIVGDYVEESESLRDCACEGRAASAIACLFDRTLLGWHRSAERKPYSLYKALKHHFPWHISKKRFARARALGATQTLKELGVLFKQCTSAPVLIGPIHGDLHSANVRVRATDAIVIDFFAHRNYPLVYDAACLEASLLIEGFSDDKRSAEEWLESVGPLYEHAPLDGTLPYANPKSGSFWFYACVHQIRRYARQWECGRQQYAGALAVALLTKATKDLRMGEPGASRRAGAYVLAERILSVTFGSASKS